jgi:hypothetical protein
MWHVLHQQCGVAGGVALVAVLMVCIFSSSLLGLHDNNELTVNESELKT